MKKSSKLLILAAVIVAMSCSILKTSADTKEVKLVLVAWNSACTGQDYDFSGYDVSATDTPLNEVAHDVDCVLLSTAAANVNVQIVGDLSSAEWNHIAASNFVYTTEAWNVNGSLVADADETSSTALNTPTSIYTKGAYKVWDLTWINLKLDGTIPWGTPAWTYTGSLHITVQE